MAFIAVGMFRFISGAAVGTGAGSVKSIWHYVSNDDHATASAANYFNSFANQLVVGDIILASLALASSPQFRAYMVTANTGTVVTIAQVNNS